MPAAKIYRVGTAAKKQTPNGERPAVSCNEDNSNPPRKNSICRRTRRTPAGRKACPSDCVFRRICAAVSKDVKTITPPVSENQKPVPNAIRSVFKTAFIIAKVPCGFCQFLLLKKTIFRFFPAENAKNTRKKSTRRKNCGCRCKNGRITAAHQTVLRESRLRK